MTTDQIRATLNRIAERVALEKRNIARMEALEIENQRRFRAFLAETAVKRQTVRPIAKAQSARL